jgi:solute carrier family 25 (mitochondrial dicarboxylate transporter), member 10
MSDNRLLKEMLAASAGMTCASALLNPLEVLKVRYQQRVCPTKDMMGCFRWSVQGGTGIFRGVILPGMAATCIREALNGAFRVGLYKEAEMWLFRDIEGVPVIIRKLVTGTFVGALCAGAWSHTDLVKTLMQSQTYTSPIYLNTWDCYRQIWRSEGLYGLFRGLGPNMLRASVITTSHVGSYDITKQYMLSECGMVDGLPLWAGCGLVSSLVTTTLSAPVDLVRTRRMMDANNTQSSWRVMKNIIASEGPLGMFRGWTPSFLRFGPHFTLSWPLFEILRTEIFKLDSF